MEFNIKTILGDDLYIKKKALILKFNGNRIVISTSLLNGGTRDNIKFVFNFDGKGKLNNHYIIEEDTYLEHLRSVAIKLGLDPNNTTGLSTSADIRNFGISSKQKNETKVVAIITAGVGGNASRAGDVSSFDEMYLEGPLQDHATINIILEIDANLSKGALTNALITATEAKSALLQELQIGSLYSNQIATGTGTDGCIIISNRDSNYILTNSGKHSLLGELIANAVKDALKQALFKQEKITSQNRFDFFNLAKRYGITEKEILKMVIKTPQSNSFSEDQILKLIKKQSKNEKIIIPMILIIHLLDQVNWQIIKVNKAIPMIEMIKNKMLNDLNLEAMPKYSISQDKKMPELILELFKKTFVEIMKINMK
ncbi:MAG: adenosylcobinamide amidohydrolase [Promethearchaeota archaeon]